MGVLQRIVRWMEKGIEHERDQRHGEIARKEVGLIDVSREVCTKCPRGCKERGKQELDRSSAKQCRCVVARMNYFGKDMGQIQFAVEELSRGTAYRG